MRMRALCTVRLTLDVAARRFCTGSRYSSLFLVGKGSETTADISLISLYFVIFHKSEIEIDNRIAKVFIAFTE